MDMKTYKIQRKQ